MILYFIERLFKTISTTICLLYMYNYSLIPSGDVVRFISLLAITDIISSIVNYGRSSSIGSSLTKDNVAWLFAKNRNTDVGIIIIIFIGGLVIYLSGLFTDSYFIFIILLPFFRTSEINRLFVQELNLNIRNIHIVIAFSVNFIFFFLKFYSIYERNNLSEFIMLWLVEEFLIYLLNFYTVSKKKDNDKKKSQYNDNYTFKALSMFMLSSLLVGLYTRSDIIIISYFSSDDDISLYATCIRLVELSLGLLVVLLNYIPSKTNDIINRIKSSSFFKVLKINIMIFVACLILTAFPVSKFLYVCLLGLPLCVAGAVSIIVNRFNYIQVRPDIVLSRQLIFVPLNILLTVIAVPILGILGAMIATFCTQSFGVYFQMIRMQR